MDFQFIEQQKFNQWWIWIFLIPLGLFAIYGGVRQLFFEIPFGDKPLSDAWMIIFLFGVLAFIYFFRSMKLITEINAIGIKMRFVPMTKREVKWQDIKAAKIVNYGFVGYGIRYGSKYGIVFNTSGNKGLAIELKNGKKFVIGTQKEQELLTVLDKHFVSSSIKNNN